MLSKRRIGAARMPPKCWASVTKPCFTRFASLGWIRGARPGPAIRRRKYLGEVLPVLVPRHPILRLLADTASAASTCKSLVAEGALLTQICLCPLFGVYNC